MAFRFAALCLTLVLFTGNAMAAPSPGEKAAIEKAHAAALADPDLQAARAKLASFDPAPVKAPAAKPFRGSVPLTKAVDELAADLH